MRNTTWKIALLAIPFAVGTGMSLTACGEKPEPKVANVKPGRIMFELSGVAEPVAREAMRRAIHKLPMKCRFITREGEV